MKKVGLALGGGACRGFAHIGVLQVLLENEIPIHAIAGTSMGAVLGGIYVCGTDLDMMERMVPELNQRDYMDVVLPKHGGVLRGNKLRDLINVFTKGYHFDQTNIPFCAVSADLLTGELVRMSEGPIIDAIRASMAVPGVFEPVHLGERILVDGCVLERVPNETVRKMGMDIVIGVDVGYRSGAPHFTLNTPLDYALAANEITSAALSYDQERFADIMICPDVSGIDPISTKDFARSVENGRIATRKAIPQILELLKQKKKVTRTQSS